METETPEVHSQLQLLLSIQWNALLGLDWLLHSVMADQLSTS